MKILHILDHSLPLHSGYTFRSQNLFRAQRKMGFDPVILTSPKHEQSWKGEWAEKEIINDFTYYRTGKVSANGRLPVLPEIRLVRKLGQRLSDVIEREKPDILHAHSPFLNAMAATRIARQKGIPLVYEIRAFWEDAAVDHGTTAEGSWRYNLIRYMETRICRRADHVAVLCNGLKQDLIRRGIPEAKLTPVFNGINPADFKTTPADPALMEQYGLAGKTVIGFIGSFYRYEGLDLLVKAFSKLAPKYPELVLLLVGGGEMESELKALATSLGLNSDSESQTSDLSPQTSGRIRGRVILPGRLPHDRVPGVYALVDILAYPRHPMRLTNLVTPLKPLEAMAMGKALVASDVGGHKELIRDGYSGRLFPAGSLDGLSNALEALITDHDRRTNLARQGQQWVVENHTWEKTTAVYEKIYKQVLAISV